MKNPKYEEGFIGSPEQIASIDHLDGSNPILSIGIRTITHNRAGLALIPHKVVVIEMADGDEIASFDLPPVHARYLADKMKEYADKIEGVKSFREIKQSIKEQSNGPPLP